MSSLVSALQQYRLAHAASILVLSAFLVRPALAQQTAVPEQWVGEFKGSFSRLFAQAQITITADHRFSLRVRCALDGGSGAESRAAGRVQWLDDWLLLEFDTHAGACPMPNQMYLYAFQSGEQFFLVDKSNLDQIINAINASIEDNTDSTARRGADRGKREVLLKFDSHLSLR